MVIRAYEFAATGLTDREVAGRIGLGLHTVRGILTSPLYRGRLRDGFLANRDRVVDDETWQRVADLRAARNRRSPGRPETRRTYALPMLECAACGRRLVGDKDRYRHLEACEPFMAARPTVVQVRGRHRRIPGQSYGRDEYEAIVPFVLERVRLGAMPSTKQRTLIRAAQVPSLISSAWHGSRRSASGLWPHIAGTATRSPSNRR